MHHSRNFTTLETYDPASRRVQSPTRERRTASLESGDCSAPGGVTRMAAGNLAVLEGIVMGRRSAPFRVARAGRWARCRLAVADPGRAGKEIQRLQDPADAVGRSRSPGQLHQPVRGRHAARTARRIRGRKLSEITGAELGRRKKRSRTTRFSGSRRRSTRRATGGRTRSASRTVRRPG